MINNSIFYFFQIFIMISYKDIKFDCRYFRGDIPCTPSKNYGVNCLKCDYYSKFTEKILIIKLGAAGDVIRTTPILYPLKKSYPDSKIFWLTRSKDLVPMHTTPSADVALSFNLENVLMLQKTQFDIVINLDKDNEAIALMDSIEAKQKFGYTLKNGYCVPVNERAYDKYMTGVFDEVSIANKKSYPEEIFEICGYKFNKEKYLLDIEDIPLPDININASKPVVGFNTGCGSRWTSRLWKNEYWIELIKLLEKNYEVVLLGGEQEDITNKYLADNSSAKYFGYFNLKTFISLMNKCDVIVTQVTMGLHIAVALNKYVVLMNNIFNPNEFELYGNGGIISPRKACKCFFRAECINDEYKCMDTLMPEDIFASIKKFRK